MTESPTETTSFQRCACGVHLTQGKSQRRGTCATCAKRSRTGWPRGGRARRLAELARLGIRMVLPALVVGLLTAKSTDAAPKRPAAPASLVATAVSTDMIDVSWSDRSSNETGFDINRCIG